MRGAPVLMPLLRQDADDHHRFLVAALEEKLHPHLRQEHRTLSLTFDPMKLLTIVACSCGCVFRIPTMARAPVTEVREAIYRHAEEANDSYLRWARDDD